MKLQNGLGNNNSINHLAHFIYIYSKQKYLQHGIINIQTKHYKVFQWKKINVKQCMVNKRLTGFISKHNFRNTIRVFFVCWPCMVMLLLLVYMYESQAPISVSPGLGRVYLHSPCRVSPPHSCARSYCLRSAPASLFFTLLLHRDYINIEQTDPSPMIHCF